jgi:predicted  nucleic acid-binding Zn-ribbon protein
MKAKTKLINMLYQYYKDMEEYLLAKQKDDKLIRELSNEITRLRNLIDTKNNEIHTLEIKYNDKEFELFQLRESIPAIKNMSSEQMLEYLRCIESTQS